MNTKFTPDAQPVGAGKVAKGEQDKSRGIVITLRQAEKLIEFFGGADTSVTVCEPAPGWEQQMPGLYAYCTEYPEEGAFHLGATEVDFDLHKNPTATGAQVAKGDERTPWLIYLSDRADGCAGHYAIARWNPAGYREVWNLRSHQWAAFSDDVLTLEQAQGLLRGIAIPTESAATPAERVKLTEELRAWAAGDVPLSRRDALLNETIAYLATPTTQEGSDK